MTFRDTASLAFRNLGQAKLRTSLTTLGVSIGIASLAGMMSLGVGLQDQTVGRFTRSGVFDGITVIPSQPLPPILGGRGRGRRPFGQARAQEGQAGRMALDDDAIRQLASLEHVREVYPGIRVPVEVKFEDRSEFAAATGVPLSLRGEGAFQSIPYGAFFSNDTDNACMLSLALAKRIDEANPGRLIGRELTLTHAIAASPDSANAEVVVGTSVQRVEEQYRIVGIVERETGPAGGSVVSPLMIPLAKARAMSANGVIGPQGLLRERPQRPSYASVTVKVVSPQHTQDVEDRIKQMGFSAFSLNDALAGAKRAFIILDIILSLVGSIALAVSSLGIVNTMVMSILERTREIGIMKAIGGSDADIRTIFLIEASAIGLIGGVTGVILGWIVGRLVNFGANIYIQNQGGTPGDLFSLPLWLVGGAIGFSVALSLIAGLYPASRAARLDPIRALRHD
jgi:putative ABC transport system permease protein